VNQPILPYAIIVVNAFEPDVCGFSRCLNPIAQVLTRCQKNGGDWYNEGFTDKLLENMNRLNDNPQLSGFVEKWKALEREIKTLKDLIFCYYSGLKIICVPHNRIDPGPFLIEQYKALYQDIGFAADAAKKLRQQRGLLWDWHQLDIYLGYAFDHFSRDPVRPFNFLNAGFNHSPVRSTFHTHILAAANRIKDRNCENVSVNIFEELVPLIASSILLDICRKKLPHNRMSSSTLVSCFIIC